MSASSTVPSTATRRSVPAPDAFTTAGAVLALGCTLAGTFLETPWKDDSGWGVDFHGHGGWAALGVNIAVVAVSLVLVGLATARARALPPQRTAVRALVLAGLGVVAIAVFYLGIPSVLAAGAAGVALDARRRLGRLTAPATVALVLAALTVATAVYLAFTG
ncbi:hypothetical protein FHU33_4754 [Blastococcus colisei]|uniref:Tripartite tricarboxylate transporter TctB family protein n=1 Tax=Blastococcus colisei TaxID=1564162 RepID=A0A543P1S2_9ACTN|nr:hypothetical protein [Blastococcus colisei]TQN38074.1 hypothetical protein FHU33_4754 [Blastococcus colisei]